MSNAASGLCQAARLMFQDTLLEPQEITVAVAGGRCVCCRSP